MGPVEAARMRFSSSLRGKALFIVGMTILGLVAGLYSVSRIVLLRGFAHLEEEFTQENLDRASSALSNELATLDATTNEYASWDQTYAFVHGQNPTYVKTEFPPATFAELKVSFVAVLDNSGRKIFSRGFNPARMDEMRVPAGLDGHLKPGSALLAHKSKASNVMGILVLPQGPVLIDSRPVLTSNAEGPAAGTMIMGRVLDEDEAIRLGAMTHMPLEIKRLDAKEMPDDFQLARSRVSQRQPKLIRPIDEASIAAYEELDDIYGKPALILRVMLPRTIYRQGLTSLLQILLLLCAAGFVFGAATLFLLERYILSRVADLSENITQIGASGNLAERLPVTGQDELAYLGTAINGMLEDLEKTETERHEGRMRLSVLMEKMPAVLWTTDTELRFTSSVGAGLAPLKLRANEMVGQSLFEYFHTEDPEFVAIAAHQKAIAGEVVTYELEWQKRVFESHVQPLHNPEGELLGVIGVALDITDRRHLADQLRQSQKMQAVGELAGGISHDFNNLLMVVKGHGEMLLDRLAEASPLRQNVEQIQKAADRAAALTRQLLAFSRKQVLQPRVLELNEVVNGMIQMFARVIGENIELRFLPAAGLSRVKADPAQMEQVLLNLVVNARDAMPDGGRLTIETSSIEIDSSYAADHAGMGPGHYAMLVVSDTGCGMDTGTQSRIFEPFFTTKAQGKGTGLGLATVYGVVKQSGGFIWVYSEVGRGTTFKIYLPEVTADVDKRAADKVAGGLQPGHETILFVEDEDSVRVLVRGYLEAAGYRVLEAEDGVHALELTAKHTGPIHMLITDVVMPRMSGRELATRLAAKQPDMKVLYISGYTDDSIFRDGVLEGGMFFLQKPFNLRALAQKIREVLEGQAVSSLRES
jgi:PAS domain S-box-containing protein